MYEFTDRAIATLNKRAVKRFNETTKRLNLLLFDELSVVTEVKTLYERLDADNKEVFLALAKTVYANAYKLAVLRRNAAKIKRDAEEQEEVEEITEFWLLDFLDSYSPVTKYRYTSEIVRKREYTTEAVNSVTDKSAEMKRGLLIWSRFAREYCDLVTDAATLKAYKDAGVKRVRWETEEDDRVCQYCRPLDGEVFDIDKVPPKQHLNCRCILLSVD